MKRSIALILILILTLATVACGNTDSTGNNSQGANTPDTTDAGKELPSEKDEKYNEALTLMSAGKYDEAIEIFSALEGHRDSADMIEQCKYLKAVKLVNAGQHDEAYTLLFGIKDNKDAAAMLEKFEWKYTKYVNSTVYGDVTTYTYKYSEDGLLTESAYDIKDYGKSTYTYTYTFYDNGNVKVKTMTSDVGKVDKYLYEYDDRGNVTKETVTYTNGAFTMFTTFEYDDNNNMVKETTPENDFVATHEYDDHKNRTKTTMNSGNTVTYENEYDSNGTLVKTTRTEMGHTIVYTYEYDDNGNLIKEISDEGNGFLRTKEYSGYTLFYMG